MRRVLKQACCAPHIEVGKDRYSGFGYFRGPRSGTSFATLPYGFQIWAVQPAMPPTEANQTITATGADVSIRRNSGVRLSEDRLSGDRLGDGRLSEVACVWTGI